MAKQTFVVWVGKENLYTVKAEDEHEAIEKAVKLYEDEAEDLKVAANIQK